MKLCKSSLFLLASTSQHASGFVPSITARAFVSTSLGVKGKQSEGIDTANVDIDSSAFEDPTIKEDLVKALGAETKASEAPTETTATVDASSPTSAFPEVFPGIRLPPWDTTEDPGVLNEYTVQAVQQYGLNHFQAMQSIIGQPKTEGSLDASRNGLFQSAHLADSVPSKDYQFFGNGDYKKQLSLLVKTNPFMASALTTCKQGGFELKAYDPNETEPSLFLRITRTLQGGGGHRVNVQFDEDMEIQAIQVFDDETGQEIPVSDDEKDIQKYASAEIYNLFSYASAVHATIHVFHFLLTSGLMEATKDFEAMNEIAISYGRNIRNKYLQVAQLLIQDPNPAEGDKALITGVNGMGGSQAIRPILQELLDSWGEITSARDWFNSFMNLSEQQMDEAGILCEFRKHLDLVAPFARDLKRSMYRSDASPFGTYFRSSQQELKRYLRNCGTFPSKINKVQTWLELMSVTGIVHGATLSYSRVLADPMVARWRNAKTDKWDAFDFNMIFGVLGTIVGMEEGRHVMGSELDEKVAYNSEIQQILNDYDGKANQLKQEYKEKLLKGDLDEFNNFGFILTDYGPDDFDGKQLTIATYI